MTEFDPFEVLANPNDLEWPVEVQDLDLFGLAYQQVRRNGVGPVRALLTSPHKVVRRRGLFLFGEYGGPLFELLDCAHDAADTLDDSARSLFLGGVLSLPSKLSASRLARLLPYADSSDSWLRSRLITLLSCVSAEVLEAAVLELAPDVRSKHKHALTLARDTMSLDEASFGVARRQDKLTAVYFWSELERLGRKGSVYEFAHLNAQDDAIARSVRFHIVRFSKRYKSERAHRLLVFRDWEAARNDART